MKSLCTCAAFAVAAAIAQGSFATAFSQNGRALRTVRSTNAADLTPIGKLKRTLFKSYWRPCKCFVDTFFRAEFREGVKSK